MVDAPNRAALGILEKSRLVPRKQGNKLLPHQRRTLVKVGQLGSLRVLVPRTDQLAIIASIDTITHRLTKLLGDGAVIFYSEIRKAATRIDYARRHDGCCRAHIYTRSTRAAVFTNRFCGPQREIHKDFT